MTAASEESAQAAVERAYRAVLEGIVSGRLTEGQWLRESALAEHVGVSRTPVREALKRLAAEGAVELHLNRGAQIATLSETDAVALFELRVHFEPMAVRLAVPRLDSERLDRLAELDERMRSLCAREQVVWSELTYANNEFHQIFIEHAGNRHLSLALQSVARPVTVARTFQRYTPAALERSMHHHAEILEAARAGDGEWASAVMQAHILATRHAQDAPPSAV